MKNPTTSLFNRLRFLGWLEGSSLLILLTIAVPAKHLFGYPELVKFMGPLHGVLFILYYITALQTSIEQQWPRRLQWKLLLACFLPFGTFYMNRTLLSKAKQLK